MKRVFITADDILSSNNPKNSFIVPADAVITDLARETALRKGITIVPSEDSIRKILIAGNWKMNLTLQNAVALSLELIEKIRTNSIEVAICVPFPYISIVSHIACKANIITGAQNVSFHEKGAYTGEVSADMLLSCGATMVLIGHSERRTLYNETDSHICMKIKRAFESGLTPVLCVGESLRERENGKTLRIIKNQLSEGLNGLRDINIEKLVIAYEPVWAIGTGKTATPLQAQEVHRYIRSELNRMYGNVISGKIRILYGGSMNASNCGELLSQPDIDGGLIGGASLKSEDFAYICKTAEAK